jgi:hypothetical protein
MDRELYWSTSEDGKTWAADQKWWAWVVPTQVSNMWKNKLVSVFNYHPEEMLTKNNSMLFKLSIWKNMDKSLKGNLFSFH